MSSKDSGKQESTILGVAEASVAYGPDVADGADGAAAAAAAPLYRPLNLARLEEQGMLTQEGGRSSVAEDFRIIKRPLLRQARASGAEAIRHGNLIVVTSAMPGEGKTYCAINLAMSIAMEMDITVLLVDADVARPSVLKVLGLPPEPGLMDVLLDPQLSMGDVILKTNVANLRILPAGRSNKHATELLASRAMSRLLAEIASRYSDRVVVFDSPPLLITSEAHALVGQMGQVVMVVEAEKTTQHAVKEALRQIEACEHIHLIYNKTKSFPGNDYYGYGYYD